MANQRELILINICGTRQKRNNSGTHGILARYDADILDIGQADIHHTLSLGILFKTDSHRSGEILKELLFKTNDLNREGLYPISSVSRNTTAGSRGRVRTGIS